MKKSLVLENRSVNNSGSKHPLAPTPQNYENNATNRKLNRP